MSDSLSTTSYYYTRDHLGSVREMCSSTGTITSRMAYDPYGVTTTVSGSTLPTKQYAGMMVHPTSGLYMTRAGEGKSTGRIYDTSTGQWSSRDPLAERGGINLYDYCANNPITQEDGLGLCCANSVDLITSGTFQGGLNIISYYPALQQYPQYGSASINKAGSFSDSGGTGAYVQMIGHTTGGGSCTWRQSYIVDGTNKSVPDNDPTPKQINPTTTSTADSPGQVNSPTTDGTTFFMTLYSTPGECCTYSYCTIEWRQETNGHVREIAKFCQRSNGR